MTNREKEARALVALATPDAVEAVAVASVVLDDAEALCVCRDRTWTHSKRCPVPAAHDALNVALSALRGSRRG